MKIGTILRFRTPYFLIFMFCVTLLKGQASYVGNLTLSTQSQVDNFDFSTVTGNLYVSSSILNVDGLSSLTHVGGNLSIANNPNLTNLDGFLNLTYVGGFLSIFSCSGLTHIDDFPNLLEVHGNNLSTASNLNLVSISGFIPQTKRKGKKVYF